MLYLSPGRYRPLLQGACLGLLLTLGLCAAQEASGQILRGPWVDETELAIDQHRKSDVIVIVLDEQDRAVMGATVRITQTRHAFPLGLTIPGDRRPPESAAQLPLFRCFNAIALDRLTQWTGDDPRWPKGTTEQMRAWQEAIRPIETAFGPVISGDAAYNFDGVSQLAPGPALEMIGQRVDSALDLDPAVQRIDLFADAAHEGGLRQTLGFGLIPRIFEQARSAAPDAKLNLRFRNALDNLHARELGRVAQAYELRQVGFDGITIEQQFTGQVQPLALRRTLSDRIANLPAPVTIAKLGVSGTSAMGAMINLETVLRQLFAEPAIRGIYLEGLTINDVIEPEAALIDEQGDLTPSGQLIDDLFRGLWWSEAEGTTDDRGNFPARIFKGWYEIEATFADGAVIYSRAYINTADGESRYVVLQRTAGD